MLKGATRTLEQVDLLELELSLVPLYEEGPLYMDMLSQVADLGFAPVAIQEEWVDPESGAALQLNCILGRHIT